MQSLIPVGWGQGLRFCISNPCVVTLNAKVECVSVWRLAKSCPRVPATFMTSTTPAGMKMDNRDLGTEFTAASPKGLLEAD